MLSDSTRRCDGCRFAPAGGGLQPARRSGPDLRAGPAGRTGRSAAGGRAAAQPTQQAPSVATPGVFNVWFNANWNTVTDEAVGNTFVEWGNKNGIKVEWQSIPASPQVLAKQSAAVAAGQPPEITNQNLVYWYTQGELANLKDLANKFKDQAGGMYPIGISSLTAPDGGVFGVPYGIHVWPPQCRTDIIGPATRGR